MQSSWLNLGIDDVKRVIALKGGHTIISSRVERMILFIWGGRESHEGKIGLFRRTNPLMRYIENVSNGIFENGKD
jgi:hypothetical protein